MPVATHLFKRFELSDSEKEQNSLSTRPLSPASSWSFRDPAGRVIVHDRQVWRIVNSPSISDLNVILSSRAAQDLIGKGELVASEKIQIDDSRLPDRVREHLLADPGATVLEHESIWFPSFPHEWAPEMLYEAGKLTLDVAEALLPDGLGLKDATPFNVLFRGPRPVFIDLMSIEKRDEHDPLWLPYAQFLRTFLLPLLANRYYATPLQRIFLSNREGLEPEEVFKSSSTIQHLRPPFLGLVSIPTWLSGKNANQKLYQGKRLKNVDQANFVLRGTLKRLRRSLEKVRPSVTSSRWSSYTDCTHYSDQETAAKLDFVTLAVEEVHAQRVLDVGCNTGRFSRACAQRGIDVVAIDSDPVVVGRLWRHATVERLKISPIVLNFAQPTPATGWRNEECPSFLDRARRQFDMVLMLAVIHHLLVTDRIPLPEIFRCAADLARRAVVMEFVPGDDPMFRGLLRGRDSLHADFTQDRFEQQCAQFFRIARKQRLAPGGRWLYLLTR